jgi:glycosyltransferase involved in cell wall biosynthesis
MRILFIHQNFPGQFKHLAPALARAGHDCRSLTLRVDKPVTWHGVSVMPYRLRERSGQNVHPWLVDLDTKVTRGEACFRAAQRLKDDGYAPDLILAHPGWGEAMFLREVWPQARMALYCELYHHADYPHLGFDPEFDDRPGLAESLRIRLKNLNNHLHFPYAEAGLSPTRFQANTFPDDMRAKITVIHDGIDTRRAAPDPEARFAVNEAAALTRDDEVVTFVNRNLEPYRGYHVFMRALPRLLRERPFAQVVIVGGDEVSYGARPPEGRTWKQIFIDEVHDRIPDDDWARVHFVGRIDYDRFLSLLQVSRVHVYLTYPFVLSWSLLEAMSCGAAIVASDTAPVREVVHHGQTGRLVDFFDGDALVGEVCALLDNAGARADLGAAARALMCRDYDLNRICLPRQMAWIDAVTG